QPPSRSNRASRVRACAVTCMLSGTHRGHPTMRAPRLLGLLILALFVAVAAVSAQPGLPPGVKLPTVIKPGGGPGMPQVKPAPPPVKTPPVTGQPGPGGKDPGTGA